MIRSMVFMAGMSLACACLAQRAPEPLPPEPPPLYIAPEATAISLGFLLSDRQLDMLQRDAGKGDSEAAFRLFLHFRTVGDPGLASYWLLTSALGGHKVAQHWQWVFHREATDCATLGEALAWLESSQSKDDLPGFRETFEACRSRTK